MDFEVKLPQFEGPLDLLLHLVQKDKLDIYDLPLAHITKQYLRYLELMKEFNMELAGEFLIMAATLIHIKSRMLLPQISDEEEEDPRMEIVRPLLEYMRLKEAAQILYQQEILGRDVFVRSVSYKEIRDTCDIIDEYGGVSVTKLFVAFKRLLERRAPVEKLLTYHDDYPSVEDQIKTILDTLKYKSPRTLNELLDGNRIHIVTMFFALLELIKKGMVRARQSSPSAPLWIYLVKR